MSQGSLISSGYRQVSTNGEPVIKRNLKVSKLNENKLKHPMNYTHTA